MADLHISDPLTLKCGLTLPNRLTKAAMAESMSTGTRNMPGPKLRSIYGEWAKGGWGMILTGNVQVDKRYLGAPGDVTYDEKEEYNETFAAWKAWAEACSSQGTPAVVQINHPGRQSPYGAGARSFFTKNLAPSAVPLSMGKSLMERIMSAILFGTPKEMTTDDIEFVTNRFVNTAVLASKAGFAGVELHGAHGYLLTQFLSEKTNKRTDAYGGSPVARAKIVVDILTRIRAAVPKGFCVGVKFNSVDHQSSQELSACIEQLKVIAAAGVDFLEISGGSYEDPTMSSGLSKSEAQPQKKESTRLREAFFLEFAHAIRKELPDVPLMVTGGFRSRAGMEAAVKGNDCDLIGVGRPAIMNPTLPKEVLLNPDVPTPEAGVTLPKVNVPWILTKLGIKNIGAGADTIWFTGKLVEIATL